MKTIEVKFSLTEKVWIEELERYGIIISINISSIGTRYELRYFDDAEPHEVYFYEWELLTETGYRELLGDCYNGFKK